MNTLVTPDSVDLIEFTFLPIFTHKYYGEGQAKQKKNQSNELNCWLFVVGVAVGFSSIKHDHKSDYKILNQDHTESGWR